VRVPGGLLGRIPFAKSTYRRLKPGRFPSLRTAAVFEDMIRQLVPGLLNTFEGGKISWEGLPLEGRWKASTFQMDWAAWTPKSYNSRGSMVSAFLNFEATIHDIREDEEYLAKKLLSLARLADQPGGVPKAVDDLKGSPEYAGITGVSDPCDLFLIIVSNVSAKLPESNTLRKALRGKGGTLEGTHPDFDCQPTGASSESLVVKTPKGRRIHVGLVNLEKLLELSNLAIALDRGKQHRLIDERFLFDLTSTCNNPLLLDPMPTAVDIFGLAPGAHLRIEEKSVTFHRFSIAPFEFLRMSTVLRLVSDYSYLQRLPDGSRLSEMAQVVEAGDRFPTPILCIPAAANGIEEKSKLIVHTGGLVVSPYQWHIIDGQHRVFCYYFVERGVNVQTIDVNSYQLASSADKPVIASALFLDVNFRAERPSEDLGLSYYAYSRQWPGGAWVPRKRGRGKTGSKDFYSSRILASRLLLEMNSRDTCLCDLFKSVGVRDPGKVSIKSLSTYLAPDFDLIDPSDSNNVMARRFGTVGGAEALWTVPGPSPESLEPLWDRLCAAYDFFCTRVASGFGESQLAGVTKLQELIRANNNVFVGLWRAFHSYAIDTAPASAVLRDVPEARAHKVMRWLVKEYEAGHLTGKTNRYKSGSGAKSLPPKLVAIVKDP